MKHLRRLLWWMLALLVALTLAALAALAAALQSEPTVAQDQDIAHEDVARALSLLRTHDPRRAP